MKKLVLILSFLTISNFQAKQPAINYLLIHNWCTTIQSLQQDSLQLLKAYLQDLQIFAECNVKDSSCFTSQEGKALQQKLDEDIAALMKDQKLTLIFKELTMLIKEEVGQERIVQFGRRKKEYKILAAIATGCLECVEKKLSIL